ncbi:MAG: hypothetical protein ACK4FV_05615 [Candidatus Nitrosocaldus sp.]
MDTEGIVALILKHRPDLTREDVLSMARAKMEKIGAGYLTEQGALFLVAADLGIRIDEEMSKIRLGSGGAGGGVIMALKDLYSGARDVSIVARVMKIYPVKRYSRKSDGAVSKLRRLVVYDNEKSMSVNLWDDAVDAIERLGIEAGDAIRISRAYVKSGLDGSTLVINTGMKSSVEPISLDDVGKGSSIGIEIKRLEDMAIDVSDIGGEVKGDNLVVTGMLCSNPIISTYRNKDGEESKVMSMLLQGSTSKVRVVVWDLNYANLARMMPLNSKIMVTGIRVRRDGEKVELHGDSGSIIRALKHGWRYHNASNIESSADDEDYLELIRLKILAIDNGSSKDEAGYNIGSSSSGSSSSSSSSSGSGSSRYAIVMVDSEEANYGEGTKSQPPLYLLDISSLTDSRVVLKEGMSIECIPSRVLGYTIYLDEDSYIASRDEHDADVKGNITGSRTRYEPISKIADVEKEEGEENLHAIEAIVLTMPRVDEVRRRDGSIGRRAEVLVGDDTNEARLIAWDKQVESIEALRVGERVRLYGVVARRRTISKRDSDSSKSSSNSADDYYSDLYSNDDNTSGSDGNISYMYELHVKPFTIIRHID